MNDLMNTNSNLENGSPSLLEAHLALLNGEGSRYREEATEVDALQEIRWPELKLSKRPNWMMAPIFLLAASIAVIVGRLPEQQSAVVIKGATKLFAVLEKDGKSQLMTKGQRLVTGDRMNVEIIADEPVKAFMGVFNRRGELLTPTSDLLANSLDILAGNKGYFRTAIELTKENDGEQVLIVTCSSEAWSRRFANAQAFAELYFRALPLNAKANEMADVCQSEQWKLRD